MNGGFQPIQHDRSDIKTELQHQKTLVGMSGLDEYDSEDTIRRIWTRSGTTFMPFIPEGLERTGSSPIEHDKISNKRKQPDLGF